MYALVLVSRYNRLMTPQSLPTASGGAIGLGSPRTPTARLGTAVVRDLVSAVVTGAVKPGDLLPTETELCAHFAVSRTVIRESMKRLEEKGMVRVAQGRGTEITDPDEWNILDRVVISVMIENDVTLGVLDEIAVVRSRLEEYLAESAATKATADDVEALRDAHATMCAAAGSREDFAQTDVDFHTRVMEISGDRLVQGIARTLTRRARDNARFYGAPDEKAFELTIAEHAGILEAIATGDSVLAGRRMREHIVGAWERRRIRD